MISKKEEMGIISRENEQFKEVKKEIDRSDKIPSVLDVLFGDDDELDLDF